MFATFFFDKIPIQKKNSDNPIQRMFFFLLSNEKKNDRDELRWREKKNQTKFNAFEKIRIEFCGKNTAKRNENSAHAREHITTTRRVD